MEFNIPPIASEGDRKTKELVPIRAERRPAVPTHELTL